MITPFPNFKRGATPAERFSELQGEAIAKPHKFNKMAVVYQEELPDGKTIVRYTSSNCSTNELIGIFEVAKMQLFQDTRKYD